MLGGSTSSTRVRDQEFYSIKIFVPLVRFPGASVDLVLEDKENNSLKNDLPNLMQADFVAVLSLEED